MTPAEFWSARKKLGMTQAALAAVMGYAGQTAISDIERAETTVPAQAARLMQAYLRGDRPADWPGT